MDVKTTTPFQETTVAKPRRTKEQKRQDDFISVTCQNSLFGYQCDIMKLSLLSGAGEAVAKTGGTNAEIEAAILAARDKHAVKA